MAMSHKPPDTSRAALVEAAADGTLEGLFRDALLAMDDDASRELKSSVVEAQRAAVIDLVAAASATPGPADHFPGTVYEAAGAAQRLI